MGPFSEVRELHARSPPHWEEGAPPQNGKLRRRKVGNAVEITQESQQASPELTFAKLKSDYLPPESINSRISAGAPTVSTAFFILLVGPPGNALPSSWPRA